MYITQFSQRYDIKKRMSNKYELNDRWLVRYMGLDMSNLNEKAA